MGVGGVLTGCFFFHLHESRHFSFRFVSFCFVFLFVSLFSGSSTTEHRPSLSSLFFFSWSLLYPDTDKLVILLQESQEELEKLRKDKCKLETDFDDLTKHGLQEGNVSRVGWGRGKG